MAIGKVLSVNVHLGTIAKIRDLRVAEADYRAQASDMKGHVPDTTEVDKLQREVLLLLGHHTLDAIEASGESFLRIP